MKKIIFRFFALLIGFGACLIFLELFLRLAPRFGVNYNAFRFHNENAPQINYFSRFRPSDLLGYEHIPNSPYYDRFINSYGMVGREYKLEKDKHTYRILLLGDSIAEQDWSARFLEESLNADGKLSPERKFQIWNAGVGSYDVRRYYLYLKHKGINYAPDMVMIFLFMNDFSPDINVYYKTKEGATAFYFPVCEISRKFTPNPFLMRHSYLYRFAVLKYNSYLSDRKNLGGITQEEDNGRYYLGLIKEICVNNRLPLFITIFPYLKPMSEYEDYQGNQYKIILKVIKESGIPYLDLFEQLKGKDWFVLRDRPDDDIHPNKEGHSLISQLIYDNLTDKNILFSGRGI